MQAKDGYTLTYCAIYRLFGTTGYCTVCMKVIPVFETVMRARNNVYHLECFTCQHCNHRSVLPSLVCARKIHFFSYRIIRFHCVLLQCQ